MQERHLRWPPTFFFRRAVSPHFKNSRIATAYRTQIVEKTQMQICGNSTKHVYVEHTWIYWKKTGLHAGASKNHTHRWTL